MEGIAELPPIRSQLVSGHPGGREGPSSGLLAVAVGDYKQPVVQVTGSRGKGSRLDQSSHMLMVRRVSRKLEMRFPTTESTMGSVRAAKTKGQVAYYGRHRLNGRIPANRRKVVDGSGIDSAIARIPSSSVPYPMRTAERIRIWSSMTPTKSMG